MASPPLVVLDDDPTGTQAMAGVPVLLRWDGPALAEVARTGTPVIHLVTNSRALAPSAARRLVGDAARTAAQALPGAEIVLRGDSTLRGHLLEEYLALQEIRFPGRTPVLLLVPALPAAGRITVDGVHLLVRDGRRTPLHDTEYARDPAFGYTDARLLTWAHERSGGYFPAGAGREVHLCTLRQEGAQAVTNALHILAAAGSPSVCVADAEGADDLLVVAAGLEAARAAGVEVIVRCAPTFAGVLSGTLALAPVVMSPAGGPVLVVCGSFGATATRQLSALAAAHPSSLVEADIASLASTRPEEEVRRLAHLVSARLEADGLAVLATPRRRPRDADGLDVQARIATNLAAVVAGLRTAPAMLVVKGGVTSAVTASTGLGAASAWVVGPVADGVGLWEVRNRDGEEVPYLVVPGNVGDDDLLARLVAMARDPHGDPPAASGGRSARTAGEPDPL